MDELVYEDGRRRRGEREVELFHEGGGVNEDGGRRGGESRN